MPVSLVSHALITLATAADYMNVAAGTRDDQVHRLINSVSDAAEAFTARFLAARTHTLVRPRNECGGRAMLVVPHWPIQALTEIREYSDDLLTNEIVDSSHYDLDEPAGDANNGMVIRVSGTWAARRNVKMTYVASYGWDGGSFDADLVPFDLQEAVALTVAYMDQKIQNKAYLVENVGIEGVSHSYILRAMPPEAKAILTRYRRPAGC